MELLKAELIDDGAKQDLKGRRIMPPERIEALLLEYEGSGMTLAAFARGAGVNYSTFAGWVYKQRTRANRKGPVRFAQLQLPAANLAPAELSVSFPDGVVVRGSDGQALAALVRVLRN
jgi:hypothetical protein